MSVLAAEQDPQEKITYGLGVINDTASSGSVSVLPASGGTLGAVQAFTEGAKTGYQALFGPATAGVYRITINVVCASGQVRERTWVVTVRDL